MSTAAVEPRVRARVARWAGRLRGVARLLLGEPRPVDWCCFASREAYERHLQRTTRQRRRRRAIERALATTAGESFAVGAYCWACQRHAELYVDYSYSYPVGGVLMPNWREHLRCPGCQLNNRMRATLQFLAERAAPARDTSIYLSEQTTPLFAWVARRYQDVCGSEYLGSGLPFGANDERGIRNESITKLSFGAASFDCVLSLDVIEHVPNYQAGLAELYRVLKPGGRLVLSAPFLPERDENLRRAVVDADGAVQHLLPPEYHGDPLNSEGCLAFHHFGWQLLFELRACGFDDAVVCFYWSRSYGYLGDPLTLFFARRPR